jgi:cobalamin biosynthetic protein CobC
MTLAERRETVILDALLHGGRLDAARRLYPEAPLPWLDLSTGVSPRAYPLPELPLEVFTRLPDEDAVAASEAAAARAYDAPEHIEAVAGAGVQAFIRLLPQLLPARRVAVLGFTYAEHALAWRESGAIVQVVSDLDDLASADVAVVVNPNNPDGRRVEPEMLLALARHMAGAGRQLIVDEAFVDFTPEISVVREAPGDGLIVLRSFGKAYGLPGVRLGFALCAGAMARRLRALQGPWSVSGPALAIGTSALADAAWRARAAPALERDAAKLDEMLRGGGFEVIGGTSLFRLTSHERAARICERLARRGVLARSFPERPHWLRFGAVCDEAAFARLAEALEGEE